MTFGKLAYIRKNFLVTSILDCASHPTANNTMKIKSLRKDLQEYLQQHNLFKKWEKASRLFEQNMRYPSLHTELLQPRWRGIYSFRLDKQYRALFFMTRGQAEVFQITKHYQK